MSSSKTRIRFLLFTIGIIVAVMGLLAWQAGTPTQPALSQDLGGVASSGNEKEDECLVEFTTFPTNVASGGSIVFEFRNQNADPGTLVVTPPDPAVAKITAYTESTVTVLGVGKGWGYLTVSMLCENDRQAGQRVGQTALVVVDSAEVPDDADYAKPAPERGATGQVEEEAPDLEVRNPTLNLTRMVVNNPVTLSATVYNDGDNPSSQTTLRFYQSTNSYITTADSELGTASVPILIEFTNTTKSLTFRPSTAGTYYYGACVDTFNGEFSSTNNCSSGVSLVVEPDEPDEPDPPPTTEQPDAPRATIVDAEWADLYSSGGYAEAEFSRVADDEDYYEWYSVKGTCLNGTCTSVRSTTSKVLDDIVNFDDCDRIDEDDCFTTSEVYWSFGSLDGGDSARVTFYARACKDDGPTCSAWTSDTVSYTKPSNAPAPTGVSTSNVARSSMTLSWNSKTGVVRYMVQYRPSTRSSWTTFYTGNTSQWFTSLSCGTTYQFQIAGRGDGTTYSTSYGPFSAIVSRATSACAPTVIYAPAPTGVSVSGVAATSVTVSWNAVADATGYRVQYRPTTRSSWSAVTTSGTSRSVTSLNCNTAYEFRVASRGDGDPYSTSYGSPSGSVVRATSTCPTAPAPTGSSTSNVTATSVTMSWNAVTDAAGYRVQYRPTTRSSWSALTTTGTSLSITGLTCNTSYQFRVASRGDGYPYSTAYGTPSGALSRTTSACAPTGSYAPAPTGVTASNPTLKSMTVSWNSVTDAARYRVDYRPSTRTWWSSVYTSGTSYSLTSLSCGVAYQFRVASRGDGDPYYLSYGTPSSIVSRSTTGCVDPTYAPAPTGLTTSNRTRTSLTLSWNAVSDATRFWIQYRPSTRSSWSSAYTASTSRAFSNLACNTTYQFRVAARGDGDPYHRSYGSHSGAISASTSSCPDAPAPTGLGVDSVARTSITVSWNSVTDAARYSLEYQRSGGSWSSTSTGSTSRSVSGLTCNTTYRFRVAARGNGNRYSTDYGTPSVPISGTTSVCQPAPPPSYTFTAPVVSDVEMLPNREVKISWNRVASVSRCRPVEYGVKIRVPNNSNKNIGLNSVTSPTRFLGASVTLDLDWFLWDADEDVISVYAYSQNANCNRSPDSGSIKIKENPLMLPGAIMDGGRSGGTSATLQWAALPGVNSYTVDYHEVGQHFSGNHTTNLWIPVYDDTRLDSGQVVTTSASATLNDLENGEVYSILLNWEEANIPVYSARRAFVWVSNAMPAKGKRVATYPYFGHWPDREYLFRVCANSFPADNPATMRVDERQVWLDTIAAARDAWNTVLGGTNVGHPQNFQPGVAGIVQFNVDSCVTGEVTDHLKIHPVLELIRKELFEHSIFAPYQTVKQDTIVSEMYYVDGPVVSAFHYATFIEENRGICVFFAPACVISDAYGRNAQASTELDIEGNAVDILLNANQIGSEAGVPSSTHFGHCGARQSGTQTHFQYRTLLHEFGHALGTSNATTLKGLYAPINDRPIYVLGHPTISEAVMNYDYMVDLPATETDEPDCYPQPFDVLAITALYQTLY